MSTSSRIGFLIGAIGVVFFSAKAVMVKMAYQFDIDAVELLLLRMIFALPVYLVITVIQFKKEKPKVKSTDYLWLFFFGFLGYYLASIFDFIGLKYIKAGLERIILFIYPTLVLIFSYLFLSTKIKKSQIFAILATYLGVLMSFYGDLDLDGNQLFTGGGFIFLSAICYAGYLVGSGWLIPRFGAVMFTSLAMLVSCFCVVIHYLLTSDVDLMGYSLKVYGIGLTMAVISTIIPSYLVSWSINKIGAPNFSIVGSLGPISTILLAFVFLGERFSLFQGIGTIVVITGIWYVSKKDSSTESE